MKDIKPLTIGLWDEPRDRAEEEARGRLWAEAAKKYGPEFLDQRFGFQLQELKSDIYELMTTYSDEEANNLLLNNFRAWFWGGEFQDWLKKRLSIGGGQ